MKRDKLKQLQAEEAGRAALAAAAICHEPIELPLLVALGVSTETLELLFDAGVIEPAGPSTARWADRVKRPEALALLAWSEQRRLHERLGSLLAARHDRIADAAQHYVTACLYPEARALLIRDAANAGGEKQYDRAVAVLEQCFSIWPADEDGETRLQVLGELARSARNCLQNDRAKKALSEIVERCESTDGSLAAKTHQQLAEIALSEEDFPAARRHLEAAAHLAEKVEPGPVAARYWFAYSSFLGDQTRTKAALTAAAHARKLAGEPCDPAFDSELLGYEALLHAMLGEPETAKKHVEKSLAIAMEHQLPREAAIAYKRMANVSEYRSDYAGERDAHLKAISLCRQQNDVGSAQICMSCLSYVFFRMGEWKRAMATTKDVLTQPDTHPALIACAVGVQAMIAAFRGEQRQALPRLEEGRLGLRRYGVLSFEFHFLWARAFALESARETVEAAATYHRILDLWEETDDLHDVLPGAVSAAAFFGDAGDSRQVARITDIVHKIVAANDNEEGRASRLAVIGELAATGQDWTSAVTQMTGARDAYDRLGVPIERALVRRRLAHMLVQAGREREAAGGREASLSIARSLGMRPLMASVTTSAKSSRPGRDSTLTARQHDVLQLLGAGLTNKETAARLHLSPRTVEMHVAALLERLNCRTRAEVIRRASELGLLNQA